MLHNWRCRCDTRYMHSDATEAVLDCVMLYSGAEQQVAFIQHRPACHRHASIIIIIIPIIISSSSRWYRVQPVCGVGWYSTRPLSSPTRRQRPDTSCFRSRGPSVGRSVTWDNLLKQAVGGRPPQYAPPFSSLCVRRSASRRRADRNVAVVSYGQYVSTLTAAAA